MKCLARKEIKGNIKSNSQVDKAQTNFTGNK